MRRQSRALHITYMIRTSTVYQQCPAHSLSVMRQQGRGCRVVPGELERGGVCVFLETLKEGAAHLPTFPCSPPSKRGRLLEWTQKSDEKNSGGTCGSGLRRTVRSGVFSSGFTRHATGRDTKSFCWRKSGRGKRQRQSYKRRPSTASECGQRQGILSGLVRYTQSRRNGIMLVTQKSSGHIW